MYEQISANKRNTYILFAFFLVFVVALGYVLGELWEIGVFGPIIALIIAVIYILVSYYFSSEIVLTISGAKEVKRTEYPHLWHTVEGLVIAAGISKPKPYIIEDTALNAFATGRDPEHSVIVVTTGLLEKLNRIELEGVIAHEMSHIQNFDIRVMTIITVLVGVSVLLSDLILRTFFWGGGRKSEGKGSAALILIGFLLALLTPLIAQIIKLSVSREREYLADASSALLTRYPQGLAQALEKISKDKEPLEAANNATAHLYISDPLKNNKKHWFVNPFQMHLKTTDLNRTAIEITKKGKKYAEVAKSFKGTPELHQKLQKALSKGI